MCLDEAQEKIVCFVWSGTVHFLATISHNLVLFCFLFFPKYALGGEDTFNSTLEYVKILLWRKWV